MVNVGLQDAPWTRFSLLRRNPALTPEAFRTHYAEVHGPLASAQAGFRKFTLRYVQNHVETPADSGAPHFDGVTATTQIPRDDYTRGFFQEPDYAAVKDDERYLFDVSRTVSVLGELMAGDGTRGGAKAMVLTGTDWSPQPCVPGAAAVRIHRLATANASALGFGAAAFDHPYLVECWYSKEPDRVRLVDGPNAFFGAGAVAFAVRELLVFGPELPWSPELRPA
jgi:hypothetical protein